VRGLARVTLANFGAVLFVALFMVINEDQSTAAFQLIGSGVVSLIVTTPSLVAEARAGEVPWSCQGPSVRAWCCASD